MPRHIAEKVVTALYVSSMFGRVGKRGKPSEGEPINEDFLSRYHHDKMYPPDMIRS